MARFITDCADRLNAVCDSCGVRKSKPGLDPAEFVTSPSSADAKGPRERQRQRTRSQGSRRKEDQRKLSLDEMFEELIISSLA